MADLDALFSALDGETEDVSQNEADALDNEPEKKRLRVESPTGAENETSRASVAETQQSQLAQAPEPTKGDHEPVTDAEMAETKQEVTKKEPDDAAREIATGTLDKTVRSYSAYPPNYVVQDAPVACEPAKVYAFELDPFQKQAVEYVDRNESVLVAAHTSAGKTAVAEYAVAKSLKQGQRVVYTSPIKALSNQKFRDLQEEFGADNVGLMTGDNTINPAATALVMTTEILRSMLYRGSEIMREVAWVIYDEVHYMRDLERGVVWEESIILLPHQVRFVFLSATIPNSKQFVEWIVKIHHQPCHVVYTNYRPVPLQHYIFPQGGEGLHLVVDEKGSFREKNFQKAMATLQSGNIDAAVGEAMLSSGNGKKRNGAKGANAKKKGGQFADLHRIVKLIMDRNLNPVIVFSFSKKDCERFALALNKEDYTDDVEKDLISQVYYNAIEALGEDDRKLPQVEALLPLLKRGIGIHHGGLLPILKEIVEILFAEGLIKTLFATETFSIGINMPAKTVVFTNTRKWDGKDFRWVTSGEYIQMSGRAGRRGKDDRGIVIQMLDEKMDPAVCKDILYGNPDPLNSSYRISYNMLLNLMRVEDVDPEYLLRASFHQFQREEEAPALLAQADDFQKEADAIKDEFASPEVHDLVGQYYGMDQQLLANQKRISKVIQKPEHCLRFLTPGRLIDVSIDGKSYGWGMLVSCKKRPGTGAGGEHGRLAELASGPEYILDVLLNCVKEGGLDAGKAEDEDDSSVRAWKGSSSDCRPMQESEAGKATVSMRIFTIGLDSIDRISAGKCHLPPAYTTLAARRKIQNIVAEIVRRMKENAASVPLLDPVTDLGIKSEDFTTLLNRAGMLTERLASHKLAVDFNQEDRAALLAKYERKTLALEKAKVLRAEAASCQTMAMRGQLKNMKRVLRKLGHVNTEGVIQTKGRTACEISTADELVVVEMIFAGVFNDLSVEQSVALLSAMTYDERNKDEDDPCSGMRSFLVTPFRKLQEIARTVVRVEIACGLQVDEDEFVQHFNAGMMEVVYAWCKGAKFIDIQKLTQSYEGTTIRTLRRLAELVRQMTAAAKALGNQELEAKFAKGEELLKRDIVFCSSLYL